MSFCFLINGITRTKHVVWKGFQQLINCINVKAVSVINVGGAGKLVFRHFSLAANYSNILHSKNGSEERRINPYPDGWGRTPWINIFLKNTVGVYLLSTFERKTKYLAIFKLKSEQNRSFFVIFGRLGAYLPPLPPSTTTPCLGTPPTNSPAPSSF
jgi:hypothetical protein